MPNPPGADIQPTGSPTGEPSTVSQVATGSTQNASVASDGAQAAVVKPYDWYAPDTWGDRKPEDVIKEIQKHVTGITETSKSHESSAKQAQEEKAALLREGEALLRDEKLYRSYQQRMGIQPASVESMPAPQDFVNQLPKVELTPDMSVGEAQDRFNRALSERDKFHTEYTKQAVGEALTRFKNEIYKELGQSLAPMHKSKWKNAMESATQQFGPAFMEVRNKVVAYIDGPYASLYNGDNEGPLIEKVFRAEFPDQYNKVVLSQAASHQSTVSQAATATASRSVETLPTDMSDASCIARADARTNAALRAKGLI